MSTTNYELAREWMNDGCLMVSLLGRSWGATKTVGGSKEIIAEEMGGNVLGFQNASMKVLPKNIRKDLADHVKCVGKTLTHYGLDLGNGSYCLKTSDLPVIKNGLAKEVAGLRLFFDGLKMRRQEVMDWQADVLGNAAPGMPSDEELDSIPDRFRYRVTPIGKFSPSLNEEENTFVAELAGTMLKEVDVLRGMFEELAETVNDLQAGRIKRIKLASRWASIREQIGRLGNLKMGDSVGRALDAVIGMVDDNDTITSSDLSMFSEPGNRIKEMSSKVMDVLSRI